MINKVIPTTAVLPSLNVISAADQVGASISQEVYPNIGPNPPKPPASPSLQVPPSPVATLVAWVFETWRKRPKVNQAEMKYQYLQSRVVDSNAIKSTSLRYRRNVEQRSSAPVTPSFVSERKRISHFCASYHLLHTSTHCVSSLLRDCVTRYQTHRFPCDLISPDLWFLQD